MTPNIIPPADYEFTLGREQADAAMPFGLPFCIDWLSDMIATEWRGMDKIPEVAQARAGQVLTIEAPAPHAGWV